jgi:murein DD-endopeptidase MepM/ murein hydrolase activator NlpD
VIALRTAWVLASLTILPGSYSAASTEPALLATERPAPRIGQFQLDRFPQQGALARGVAPPGTVRLVIDGHDIRFAADRRFIVGFGRDHAGSATITAFLADGRSLTERLAVGPTAWIVENLSSLPHHGQPDAEFQARRPVELAQIAAARRLVTNAQGWRQDFTWPVPGRITGHFGAQRIYAGEPGAAHAGVDLAGRIGTPVLAPADGVVILAASRPFTLEGNLLMIDHGMGLNSAFLHLSRIDVKVGDTVRQGQSLGAVGRTGRATGPHLHWGTKWQDERIDPAMLVPQRR